MWLPVKGFERTHEVSDEGQVRSLPRPSSRNRFFSGQVLSLRADKDGYLRTTLHADGRRTLKGVHRLVLETFVGPCPEGKQACHNDGIKTNNVPSNLRWATPKENTADKNLHGTLLKGERNGSCKFSEDTIKRVLTLRAAGVKYRHITELTGVGSQYAWDVVHGHAWRHLRDVGQ